MNYTTRHKSRWWMFCNYSDTNRSHRTGKQGFTQFNLFTYTLSFIWKTTREFPDWLSSLSIFDLKRKLYKALKTKGRWSDERNCAWNDVMICSCLARSEETTEHFQASRQENLTMASLISVGCCNHWVTRTFSELGSLTRLFLHKVSWKDMIVSLWFFFQCKTWKDGGMMLKKKFSWNAHWK